MILGVKYFSSLRALLPLLVWLGLLARHALTFRPTLVWWNLLAGREALRRLPNALRDRRRWGRTRGDRPGERFFTAPEFQATRGGGPT